MARAPAIGIDLGTSYSRVCFFDNGKVKIIPCKNGDRKIPSYVAFAHTGRSIGSAVKNQIATIVNPENIIFGENLIFYMYFCSSMSTSGI